MTIKLFTKKVARGRYSISVSDETWKVWRGLNGRWYGESYSFPDKMIDAPTLDAAKFDIEHRCLVGCAGAGS